MAYALTSVGTNCPDCNWYYAGGATGEYPCRRSLAIYGRGVPGAYIAVNFAGRGKIGGGPPALCATTPLTYLTFSGSDNSSVQIDIWQAMADGVWSSSVAILVYYAATAATGSDVIHAQPVAGNRLSKVTPYQVTAICPTTLIATVTVTDAGVITVT